MTILYLDCPMGISGDMFLASLIDLGVDLKYLVRELRKLPVDRREIDLSAERVLRHSISALTFRVKLKEAHFHRTFGDIKKLIGKSALPAPVKELSLSIFRLIAGAEGKVHGIPPGKVHFHEVGAMDSIIDIVGAAIAVERLGIEKVFSSPLPLGSGRANTMHGVIPIPAPATVEILKGVPVAESGVPFELTTPTGAAIVKTLSEGYGPMPSMVVKKTGYGAGKKDFRDAPNVLRAVLGEAVGGVKGKAGGGEKLIILETNIDDMTPQVAGFLMERLFEAGALEAFYTPVCMKKSRPGVLLTVLASEEKSSGLLEVIFSESTTIGVRSYPVERHCLERRTFKVKTPYGGVRLKVSFREGLAVNVQPEYEDCRTLALRKGVPIKKVMDAAKASYKGK